MTFRFKSSQCVVLGTFNMYIIQPQWLMDRRIIPKSREIKVQANLDEPGIQFTAPGGSQHWLVTPTKLTVLTPDPEVDCGLEVAKVLQKLPWTPLIAIGNNVEYQAKRTDASQQVRHIAKAIVPSGLKKLGSLHSSACSMSIQRGDQLFNLNLVLDEEHVGLRMNVHTELKGKPGTFAREVAEASVNQRRHAEKLARSIFGAKFAQKADNV